MALICLDNHPYESNLGWTIDMNDESREFIGKNALLELKESQTKLIGFYTNERGIESRHRNCI